MDNENNLDIKRFLKKDLSKVNLFRANFKGMDLSGFNFLKANLIQANLHGANLQKAHLIETDLLEADLSATDLRGAILGYANLRGADLRGADLRGADLRGADLSGADLRGADLSEGTMIRTNFSKANLTGCKIYGVSAWDLKLQGTIQTDLIITPYGDPDITVDNLEVAQFIYLLLKNEKIRYVIDTITSKVVLILGRFTHERKEILDALREELRKRNYSPVLFDFEKPANRDMTETISTLAHMARFIIADITDAKSIPQELQAIVPDLPSVPVQPLLESSYREYAMFEHFKKYPWVLETYYYNSIEEVLGSLKEKVINPAEKKLQEIR